MNLRLNGDRMKVLKGSCKNLAVFYNNKNHMTTINLAGFGLPINGYKNGYGKTAGRSYIDFRY